MADVRIAARRLIAAALPVLRSLRLFPLPESNPFVEVGREHAGSDVNLPEHANLVDSISHAHERFANDGPIGERDFATSYTYPFVEACVARLAFADDPSDLTGPAVDASVEELAKAVTADAWEVARWRVVSHLRAVDRQPRVLDEPEVIPITVAAHEHRRTVREVINSVIAGSGAAMRRSEAAEMFAPPESVTVIRGAGAKPFEIVEEMSRRIGQLRVVSIGRHCGRTRSVTAVYAWPAHHGGHFDSVLVAVRRSVRDVFFARAIWSAPL